MEAVLTALILGAVIAYLLHSQSQERAELYQRIQAPEVAIQQAVKAERKPIPRVRYDDDKSFQEAQEHLNGGG